MRKSFIFNVTCNETQIAKQETASKSLQIFALEISSNFGVFRDGKFLGRDATARKTRETQVMEAFISMAEGADECSALGCARVPPRNTVNGTRCAQSHSQTPTAIALTGALWP
ncbi:hypothetical protein Y032_0022g536 [Ancylostoma ceylanicum]|uniref:Uncharacterized protein n=1 Tax=Ancylostoma ceylanicum TaxID=53326 RepID=A0A016UZ25_9BILA|nr:hypothetical protein Y032_0022g536 [Ancylostoma ceylanicum]